MGFVKARGSNFYYDEQGEGLPILLIPPSGSTASTWVSRTPKAHGSNNVYRRLRERGYQVFAVNPNTGQVEGDRCYPDLASIPGGVDA